MTALRVTASLDSELVGVSGMFGLDAPLSWAAYQEVLASAPELLERMTDDHAQDFDLPLARVDVGDDWVWATSRAHVEIAAHTAVQIRRKPATAEMARWGRDGKHHSGAGAFKARNAVVPAVLAGRVWWDVDCVDRARLEGLLAGVTHLGARVRNGFGRVAEWMVEDGRAGGWLDRPMPDGSGAGVVEGIRAPYWHSSRQRAVVDGEV